MAILTMLTGFMLVAVPAGALEPIVIPVDTVVRGQEGEVFVLAEVSTGSEAGCEATVSAVAHNNPSVHVGNDLIVASGGAQVVLPDVESQPEIVVAADGTLTLSDTIVVMVQLGPADEGRPNSIFSGGVTVNVTCVQETTTTTAEETTTTTAEETTTTTAEETTTTTEGATTTSVGPESVTTSTRPPAVLGVSTTTLPDSTTVPPVSGDTLPFTGPEQMAGTVMAGAALLALGSALMLASREPKTTDR